MCFNERTENKILRLGQENFGAKLFNNWMNGSNYCDRSWLLSRCWLGKHDKLIIMQICSTEKYTRRKVIVPHRSFFVRLWCNIFIIRIMNQQLSKKRFNSITFPESESLLIGRLFHLIVRTDFGFQHFSLLSLSSLIIWQINLYNNWIYLCRWSIWMYYKFNYLPSN